MRAKVSDGNALRHVRVKIPFRLVTSRTPIAGSFADAASGRPVSFVTQRGRPRNQKSRPRSGASAHRARCFEVESNGHCRTGNSAADGGFGPIPQNHKSVLCSLEAARLPSGRGLKPKQTWRRTYAGVVPKWRRSSIFEIGAHRRLEPFQGLGGFCKGPGRLTPRLALAGAPVRALRPPLARRERGWGER